MYLSIIIQRMTPGFIWGLFPLPTPYPSMQTKHLWYYGVVWAHKEIKSVWPVTEHALKDPGGGSGFSWSPALVLVPTISSFRYHSPGRLSRSRREGVALCSGKEGWKSLKQTRCLWGWAQVSRSSPGEGLRKESWSLSLKEAFPVFTFVTCLKYPAQCY